MWCGVLVTVVYFKLGLYSVNKAVRQERSSCRATVTSSNKNTNLSSDVGVGVRRL